MKVDVQQSENLAARVTPALSISDPAAAYWVRQVMLRLRREVAWCWHQRSPGTSPEAGVLPPVVDAAAENLDLVRFEHEKQAFLKTDPAASYLGDQIRLLRRCEEPAGRWRFVVQSLELDDTAQFVLGLALAARLDAALAPVLATCLNDLNRPYANLALAQRLWDDPVRFMDCTDPQHAIYGHGLLAQPDDGGNPWQRPLDMPSMVARQLIDPRAPLPQGCRLIETDASRLLDRSAEILVARLQAKDDAAPQIVPLRGPKGADFHCRAASLAHRIGRRAVALSERIADQSAHLRAAACVCWLGQYDAVLPDEWARGDDGKVIQRLASLGGIPVRWYVPIFEPVQLHHFPAHCTTPPLRIQPLEFSQRMQRLQTALGGASDRILPALEECARRFRLQERMIDRVASAFHSKAVPLTADNLFAACASEAVVELGHLAQLVTPRFAPEELVLPPEQTEQLSEIRHAMQTLTVVHYHWGTAKAWNESGLSVLFSGAPGTGKTMAAETLAASLDLPMYRIDLSQVVNKYIGETEKNLKRIFDAAELSDCILFFDEADALFGKRTDVKDSHDRFANIEISYLLERMERFKGLAILATNRRKDLDEAFLRRLRYVVEFPFPGVEQRQRIWNYVFPGRVDVEALDFRYLAKQFQLSGGNIRSIALNACLRAAEPGNGHARPRVDMDAVLLSVKRELKKMNRAAGDEVFGRYQDRIEDRSR